MLLFEKCFGKVVEPACGAAMAVVYNKIDLLYKILNICNQKILLLLLYVAVHVLQGLILKGLKNDTEIRN